MRLISKRTLAALAAGVTLLAGGGTALANGGFGFFGFGHGVNASNQTALLNDVADRLNVSPANLRKAIKDAFKARVDTRVKDGLLTKTQGDALKEQIDNGSVAVTAGLPVRASIDQLDLLEAAAGYLDLTVAQLRDQLEADNSLADVAKAKNKSVEGLQNAIVAKATSQLEAAVSAGDLTDSQRDALLTRLKNTVDEIVNGEYGLAGGYRGHARPGFGGPFFK